MHVPSPRLHLDREPSDTALVLVVLASVLLVLGAGLYLTGLGAVTAGSLFAGWLS
jgi:hypothetical protein